MPRDAAPRRDRLGLPVFLLLAAGLCGIVFRDFLTFRQLYLFTDIGSDTVNAFYPRLAHVADYVRAWGLPKWSFQQGMGQRIFPWSIGNPFDLALLALGRDRLPFGIAYVECAKVLIGGAFFHGYLRLLGLTPFTRVVGALLYAFSGFMIVGSGWYVFSTEAVYMALVLFAFERGFVGGRWALLPVAFACIGLTRPFNLYTNGLFLGAYAALRQVEVHGPRLPGLLRLWARTAGLALLGAAMSAVLLGGWLLTMAQSPRVAGEAAYGGERLAEWGWLVGRPLEYATAVARLFGNDLFGTGSHFMGWRNYLEAPLFYVGLPALLLVPLAFALLPRRGRAAYGALLALAVLVVAVPALRHAFWLFIGNYYRILGLFVGLALLLPALRGLDRIDRGARPGPVVLGATLAVLLGLLYALPVPVAETARAHMRLPLAGLLVGYAGVLVWMRQAGARTAQRWVFLALLCVELGLSAYPAVASRPVITHDDLRRGALYGDDAMRAAALLARSDPGFYRVSKPFSSGPTEHTSRNDALVQNFRGTASYDNLNQLNYIRFLAAVGVVDPRTERGTVYPKGLVDRPLLETLASVKYRLERTDTAPAPFIAATYDPVAVTGGVRVLRNALFLPLGFTYDRYLTRERFDRLPPGHKDMALLDAVVVDDPQEAAAHGLAPLPEGTPSTLREAIAARRAETLDLSAHTPNRIEGTITVAGPRLLFFSIPFDRGWSARVDGRRAPLERVDAGLTGLYLEPGRHDVVLAYHIPYLGLSGAVSAAAILIWAGLFRPRRPRGTGPTRSEGPAAAPGRPPPPQPPG